MKGEHVDVIQRFWKLSACFFSSNGTSGKPSSISLENSCSRFNGCTSTGGSGGCEQFVVNPERSLSPFSQQCVFKNEDKDLARLSHLSNLTGTVQKKKNALHDQLHSNEFSCDFPKSPFFKVASNSFFFLLVSCARPVFVVSSADSPPPFFQANLARG